MTPNASMSLVAPPGTHLDPYIGAFERLERERGAADPSWLRTLRRTAIEKFRSLGFPGPRDEEWRFTNIGPIAETRFVAANDGVSRLTRQRLGAFGVGDIGPVQLVVVNGRYVRELSPAVALPAGVRAGGLGDAIKAEPERVGSHLGRYASVEQHAFRALNTSFVADGAFVEIRANTVVEEPIHLVFVSTTEAAPTFSHPRALVLVGENSQARIVETFLGPDEQYFTNAVSEIVAGPGAVVDHYRLQREGPRAFHMGSTCLHLGRSTSVTSHAVALGGEIARHDVVATLAAAGSECVLNGIYLAGGRSLVANHTEIDHAMPHCSSREVYKGILAGQARGVFNGKIRVRPDAQKTDAKQTNKTLLLSDEAQINTKPQLEILANDVKCTHGATVGQLNEEALFYLRARGIGLEEARNLLIRAFTGEVIERMALASAREQVERLIAARLAELQ
jgi:Fe-S cluster assembly protein SufD